VETGALVRGLQALDTGRRLDVNEPGFDAFVLLEEQALIHHQISNHRHPRQRSDDQTASAIQSIGYGCNASQAVLASDIHAVRAADPFSAGAPVSKGRVRLARLQKNMQQPGLTKLDAGLPRMHKWPSILISVVAIQMNF